MTTTQNISVLNALYAKKYSSPHFYIIIKDRVFDGYLAGTMSQESCVCKRERCHCHGIKHFEHINTIVKDYEECRGAFINQDESVGLQIGSWRGKLASCDFPSMDRRSSDIARSLDRTRSPDR